MQTRTINLVPGKLLHPYPVATVNIELYTISEIAKLIKIPESTARYTEIVKGLRIAHNKANFKLTAICHA